MAKKYLSHEEAADRLGISTDELTRFREKGDVRGFADRGNWKFKVEDIEEFGRTRQTDSDPEVPLISDLDESEVADDELAESSSILGSDEDVLGEQPTTIHKNSESGDSKVLDEIDTEGTSDSDVRLILDGSLTGNGEDSDPELNLASESDSDSDVALMGDSAVKLDPGSDSDVKLVDSDGIDLTGDNDSSIDVDSGSDSDVRLIADSGSDSDVALVGAGDAGSSINLGAESDEADSVFDESSDVGLASESGIGLASESGISLEGPADSGISLESHDSGLNLADEDSGISLSSDDSGISLMDIGDDEEGITLAEDIAAISDDEDDDVGLPMLQSDDDDTEFEVPALEGEDSVADSDTLEVPSLEADDEDDFGLGSLEEDDDDQSVLLFDDDEDNVDDRSATVIQKGGDDEFSEDSFDLESGDEFSMDDGEYSMDDSLDVADDVLGEDDEVDELDVFDADDDDFDETFEAGESHAEFLAPRQVAAPDVDWGTPTLIGLLVATVSMALCGMVMFDLVRSMWHWNDYSSFSSPVIDIVSGFFN